MSNGTLIDQRTIAVAELNPHPRNIEIYGDPRYSQDFGAFVQDVSENGIHPLIVADDMTIIGGHRRYYAALQLGIAEVDATVYHYDSELDKLAALIADNNQRVKSNWQIAEEASALMEIAAARAKERQATSTGGATPQLVDTCPQADNGKARDDVGEALGISGRTVADLTTVKDVVDELIEFGLETEAQELIDEVNKNARKAADKARKVRKQSEPDKPKKERAKDWWALDEWNQLDEDTQYQLLTRADGSKKFNEQDSDNIEWARWSWNPVTGCLHACDYCYARDIANRFFPQQFVPSIYPDRLTAPSNTKPPEATKYTDELDRIGWRNVFTCSMADLFGKWVPNEWIDVVLQQAWDNPQWTFLFLSKFPIRMADFDFPPNSWIGTTVDRQWAVERAEKAFSKIRAGGYQGIAWLSCEPMMERLSFSSLDMFDWVIMGGASKSTQTPEFRPPFEWIVHLWQQAKDIDLPVYMKTNIGIEQRVREYPAQIGK